MIKIREEQYSFQDDMLFPFGFVERNGEINVSCCDFAMKEADRLESEDDLFSSEYETYLYSAFSPIAEEKGFDIEIVRCSEYSCSDINDINRAVILDSTKELKYDRKYKYLTEGRPDEEENNPLTFATFVNGKIVSFAFANPLLVDDNTIDIAVETAQKYCGNGYAKSNVASLAYRILSERKSVTYSVMDDNLASVQIAKDIGFTLSARELRVIYYKKED